ncbi:MAG TPA: alkaline shock response membrane anchor protein AmaP [Candidatus Omnitrophota bacterium]|nr:alkaline shock response membrane anchor protein AmaP [Candidatus Omnitrophota bacterium]
MKVANAFAFLFSVFSFLTLGSLLLIVSLHLLSFDDAILKVQEIYQNPVRSVQSGVVGMVFIILGLMFAKMLVKEGRPNEAIIFQGESGPVVVSSKTIENTAIKAIKRFSLVKNCKVKVILSGKNVEIRLRLVLWSGANVSTFLAEVQQEVLNREKRLLGPDSILAVTCDVRGIDDAGSNGLDSETEQ